jgi:16S rRNA G1207 methylase RsmC
LEELVRGAVDCLASGGELRLVIQRRLPAGRMLEEAFARVDVVADEGPYRVWAASTV